MTAPFKYTRIVRRHGPAGYKTYNSYRDWLRDDFNFRCVYCLNRERWVSDLHFFGIDHVRPAASHPELSMDYTNLIYACSRCNICKATSDIPDPTTSLDSESIAVLDNGQVSAHTSDASIIVDALLLNASRMIEWRSTLISLSKLVSKNNDPSLMEFFGYPKDLPNLAAMRPPSNSKPEGIDDSYFARRFRGELAFSY